MALFYSPKLTKRTQPKVMSKTAMKKNLRELTKAIKEIGEYDKMLAAAMLEAVSHLKMEK